jgi:dTMP kinase
MPGRLVVFEGVEGAGKTTQLGRLSRRLDRHGIECDVFREPGGTIVGDEIRSLLLHPGNRISPATEALLFMASRAQLVDAAIKPALAREHWVLLDRFFLSTYAYQVVGRRLDEQAVREANALATQGIVPDVTILLALTASEGMDRVGRRGEKDRMEQEDALFHARVEDAFAGFDDADWLLKHPEAGCVRSVDASGSPDEVEERVWRVVAEACPEVLG